MAVIARHEAGAFRGVSLALIVLLGGLATAIAQSPPGLTGCGDLVGAVAPLPAATACGPRALDDRICPPAEAALQPNPLRIWTSCNDGHGSGLDADMLDGVHAAFFNESIARERADREAAVAAEQRERTENDVALSDRASALEGFVNAGNYRGTSAALTAGATFGGSVGIGTGAPGERLHVVGNARAGHAIIGSLDDDAAFFGSARLDQPQLPNYALAQAGPRFNGETYLNSPSRVKFRIANVDQGFVEAGTFVISPNSKLGVGEVSPSERLHVAGNVRANRFLASSGASYGDVAEAAVGTGLSPGDVVVMDGFDSNGRAMVKRATSAFSRDAIGVVSTEPSIVLAGLATDVPLAVSGIVAIHVVGPVARGDLLATSPTPGAAQACTDASACFGAVVAKAMEGHEGIGPGTIRAMIALG